MPDSQGFLDFSVSHSAAHSAHPEFKAGECKGESKLPRSKAIAAAPLSASPLSGDQDALPPPLPRFGLNLNLPPSAPPLASASAPLMVPSLVRFGTGGPAISQPPPPLELPTNFHTRDDDHSLPMNAPLFSPLPADDPAMSGINIADFHMEEKLVDNDDLDDFLEHSDHEADDDDLPPMDALDAPAFGTMDPFADDGLPAAAPSLLRQGGYYNGQSSRGSCEDLHTIVSFRHF